jgi:hypothetical protein
LYQQNIQCKIEINIEDGNLTRFGKKYIILREYNVPGINKIFSAKIIFTKIHNLRLIPISIKDIHVWFKNVKIKIFLYGNISFQNKIILYLIGKIKEYIDPKCTGTENFKTVMKIYIP